MNASDRVTLKPTETVLDDPGRRFLELLFDDEVVVAMFRVVIGERVGHRQIAELFYESGPGTVISAMERIMAEQTAMGRLRIDDLRYAAVQFVNMIRGEYQMLLLMNTRPEVCVCVGERDAHVGKAVAQFLKLYRV